MDVEITFKKNFILQLARWWLRWAKSQGSELGPHRTSSTWPRAILVLLDLRSCSLCGHGVQELSVGSVYVWVVVTLVPRTGH